jgi:hypothetical protein
MTGMVCSFSLASFMIISWLWKGLRPALGNKAAILVRPRPLMGRLLMYCLLHYFIEAAASQAYKHRFP